MYSWYCSNKDDDICFCKATDVVYMKEYYSNVLADDTLFYHFLNRLEHEEEFTEWKV